MSTTIDQKVVRMEFDNKKFESNVATSISTLDKLKKSLDFDGAEKGFEKIEKAAEGVDLKGFSESIVTVTEKFSVLEQVAIAAVRNITNGIMNTGKQLVKSVTVDQIATGFAKYEEKTGAVQTIIAATGKSIEDVNTQLEKLMWFTDETSYNFTDMVGSIGKFTANGVELETAVDAMQGIATWAALSGANATTASSAMYQLSQALASGTVKLQDWRSIENYNMGTEEFKKTVLETAAAMGTLKKQADGTYKTIKQKGSKGKKSVIVTTESFSTALDRGFFTSEVLLKSLERYGGFATLLKEAQDFAGIDVASEMLKYLTKFKEGTLDVDALAEELGVDTEGLTKRFKALADANMKLGDKAFRAAQEAKTWSEALGSVKEAVASGWMATFENIFGNYEEAKKLFTDIANGLYDVFAESGNLRNEILEEWKDLEKGGRDDLIATFWDLWDKVAAVVQPIKDVFREVFPRKSAKELGDIVTKVRLFVKYLGLSDAATESMKETFRGAFEAVKSLLGSIKALFISFKPVKSETDVLRKILSGIVTVINFLAARISSGIKMLSGFIGVIRAAAFGVLHFFSPVVDIVKELYNRIVGSGMLDKMADAVRKPLKRLELIIINLKTNLRVLRMQDLLFRLFRGIVDWITKIMTKTDELKDSKFGQWIASLIDKLKHFGKVAGEVFGVLFDKFSALLPGHDEYVNSMPYIINQMLRDPKDLSDDAKGVLNVLDKIKEGFTNFFQFIKPVTSFIGDVFSGFFKAIKKLIWADEVLDESTRSNRIANSLYRGFKKIGDTFKMVVSAIKESAIVPAIKSIGESIKLLISRVKEMFTGISKVEEGREGLSKEKLIDFFNKVGEVLGTFATKLKKFAENVDVAKIAKIAAVVLGLSGIAYGIYKLIFNISWIKDIITVKRFMVSVNDLFEGVVDRIDADRLKALWKGYATAILELAAAMWLISQIPEDRLMSAVGVVLTLMGAMKLIIDSMSKTMSTTSSWKADGASGKSKTKMASLAGTLIILAGVIVVMAMVLKKLGQLDPSEIKTGLSAMAGLTALIIAFIRLTNNKGGKGMLASAIGVLAMAKALEMLVKVLVPVGQMVEKDLKTFLKGVAVFGGFLVVIGAFAALMSKVGPGFLKFSIALAVFGAAIGVIGIGLAVLGFGLTVLGANLVAFCLEVDAAGDLIKRVIIRTLDVVEESASRIFNFLWRGLVAFIQKIPELLDHIYDALEKGLPTLVNIIGKLIDAVLQAWEENAPKVWETLLSSVEYGLKALLEHSGPILELVWQLLGNLFGSIAEKLPSVLEPLGDVLFTLINYLIDAFKKIDIEDLGEVAAELGIVEGILAELLIVLGSAALVAELFGSGTGKKLVEFVQSMRPFIDELSSIDPAVLRGAKDLGEAILAITGAEIMDSLTSWFTGDSNTFGEKVGKLGEGLRSFYDALFDDNGTAIDSKVVESAANGAKALAELNNALPRTGGKLQEWIGSKDLEDFGSSLIYIGEGLRDFYEALFGENGDLIDVSVIDSATNSAKALAALNNNLPRSGGTLQDWIGSKDLGVFGQSLPEFGKGLRGFYESLLGEDGSKIDADVVDSAANSAKALVALNNNLPAQDGLLQKMIGEKKLDVFGQQVASFGKSFVEYVDTVRGLDGSVVENSANFASTMVALENALPTTSFWQNHVTLEDFGKFLEAYGASYVKFYNQVKFLNISSILKPAVDNLRALIGVASLAGTLDPNNVAFFDATLDFIAKGSISHFMDAFSTANVKAKFEEAIDNFSDGITAATTEKEQTIIDASNAFVLAAAASIGSAEARTRMFIEGSNLGGKVIAGLNYRKEEITSTCSTIGEEAYKALKAAIEAGPEEFGPPVIRPVLDLTDIQNGVSNMYSMLSGASGLAYQSSYSVSNDFKKHNDTLLSATNAAIDRLNNEVALMKETPSMTVENTFNITGDDPKAIATEVSRILQKQVERREASWA